MKSACLVVDAPNKARSVGEELGESVGEELGESVGNVVGGAIGAKTGGAKPVGPATGEGLVGTLISCVILSNHSKSSSARARRKLRRSFVSSLVLQAAST